MVCKLAKLSGFVLEWERDALSVVNETLVLVLVQVSATAKLPPRLRVVFEVLNEAPVANVAPIGRLRVPPVEERVPAVALIPPLRDKSAAPVSIFSPAASSVTGCAMLNPAIALLRVKAKLDKSSVPTERAALSLIEASAVKRSVLVPSGTTPLKFCVPSTSRKLLLLSDSALAFVVKVVFFVFRVAPVSDKAFCSTNVVSGSEILVPDGALAPETRVIVPPEEFSDALSVNANAPERLRLPAPVSRAIPDKVRLSFTFR